MDDELTDGQRQLVRRVAARTIECVKLEDEARAKLMQAMQDDDPIALLEAAQAQQRFETKLAPLKKLSKLIKGQSA